MARSIKSFNIYINNGRIGEYSLRRNITNINGKNICPDFLRQQYNSNNYARSNCSWGYGYNALNSFDDNKSLFLMKFFNSVSFFTNV